MCFLCVGALSHRAGVGLRHGLRKMFNTESEAHMLPRMQRMVSVSQRLGGRETNTCNERSSQLANFNSHFNVSQIVFIECSSNAGAL